MEVILYKWSLYAIKRSLYTQIRKIFVIHTIQSKYPSLDLGQNQSFTLLCCVSNPRSLPDSLATNSICELCQKCSFYGSEYKRKFYPLQKCNNKTAFILIHVALIPNLYLKLSADFVLQDFCQPLSKHECVMVEVQCYELPCPKLPQCIGEDLLCLFNSDW